MNKIILSVLTIFCFNSLWAQEELSMRDAINIALENNFQIKIVGINKEIAENNNTWGEAGRLPTINLGIGQNQSFAFKNNPLSFANGHFNTVSSVPTINLNWLLFGGFRVNITKQKLSQLEELSKGNSQLVIENTLQALILSYNKCLLERARLQSLQDNLNISRIRYDYDQNKKSIGLISSYDVLQSKNDHLTDSSQYLLQTQVFETSVRSLNQIMGSDINKQYIFSDSLNYDESTEYNEENIFQESVKNNTNLKNQLLSIEIKRSDIGISKSYFYPQVEVQVGGSYNNQTIYSKEFGSGAGNSYDYYINFTLSWTLYNGGKIKRSFENSKLTQTIEELTYDEQKMTMEKEVRNAFHNHKNELLIYNVALANLETSQLNLKLTKERYQIGQINSFDFRKVQNSLLLAELQVYNSVFRLIEYNTELVRLNGNIISTTVVKE